MFSPPRRILIRTPAKFCQLRQDLWNLSTMVDFAVLISSAINEIASFSFGCDHSHCQNAAENRLESTQLSPQTSIARLLLAYLSVKSIPR